MSSITFASFKRNATFFIATCALFTPASSVFSQNLPRMEIPQNIVSIATQGTVEVQQDLLSISMNTTKEGSDAANVQSQLKQALDAALAVAKPAAQAPAMEVRTGQFSLYPRYDRGGKINGWQGTAELVLEGKDFARISQTAGKIQTLTMGNVGFNLSKEQRAKVESEAQAIAIDRFKAKALEVAKQFGFSGYTLREVAVNADAPGFVQARGRAVTMSMSKAADESAVPVEAGKSAVVVNVNGAVQLK
jgi:predicted secreted protein